MAPILDEGEEEHGDWVSAEAPPLHVVPVTPDLQQQKRQKQRLENGVDTPPPSPPSPSFAPMGRPLVRKRFRNNVPNPLQVEARRNTRLSSNRYSVNTSLPLVQAAIRPGMEEEC